MLGAKTATFAVAATLALAKTQAETAAHLRVRVHSKTTCPSGQESIGVAGWSQDGCVASGSVCVANINGDCPSGAHCEMLDTGVYGCADGGASNETSSWAGCNGTEQTIGVVGWDHDGCIDSDNVCVAQVSNGACPQGAYCSLLDTGVYGCVASSKRHRHHKSHHKSNATCPGGQESIGVAGWSQDGCVASGNVCVANTDGTCPTGAHCAWLDTGHHKATVTCPSGQESIAVAGWSQDGCVASGNVCVANTDGTCPTGAHCAWLDTGVFGCKDGAEEAASTGCNGNEQTIGVVGWDHDGCIDSDNVCVAQVSNGACPQGAYCSLLDTGVYGCVASSKH
ncbi:uncharacterized protein PITG_11883 [Phytophthora infestans T30-4]|uniref:Uncharacterized protein n=1 Tax=Phytophthora infestans (strain T30-4) TaxID=403677 RepID=D0NHG4_PHYIT|nr:uncharacterized protein PITG_11883 [Phytophthora infestans T30-4]EEY58889.1 conserved hypothetical protein [Phytophthora infestans T30-4]|eukprot:XP_002901362.1 conserved hypothetical protein [Phytophthora infestans T30-4]